MSLFYLPLDLLLGWVGSLPPVAAITLVGVLSGLAITLIQKFGSDQGRLGRCKSDLRRLKARSREAKGDGETTERLNALARRIGGTYAWGAIKPSLWTVPAITLVALWTGARLGLQPVAPGDSVEVRAHFEDGADGFAHVLPAERLRPQSPLIATIGIPRGAAGPQARWRLVADREGTAELVVRHGDRSYPVTIFVGGTAPEPVSVFGRSSPTQDQLQAVELALRPSMEPAWWNLGLRWAGLYLLVAVVVALGLRFALRVH